MARQSAPHRSRTHVTISTAVLRHSLVLLLSLGLHVRVLALTPINQGNIKTAADLWVASPDTAAATYGAIASWDTSAVACMFELFKSETTFNSNIGAWNVASVSNMASMFFDNQNFNQPIGPWNVASVTTISSMFNSAWVFVQDLGAWNVARVRNMGLTFVASDFNANIGSWNVASVTTMSSTFWDGNGGSSFFNQNLGAWNVASVSDMNMMFSKATKFNQDLSRWNVLRVTNLANMFQSANALSTCNKGAMYNLWGATLRAANPAWSGVTPQVTSALPVNTAPSQASIVTLAGLNFASTDQTPSSYLAAARQSYTPAPLRPTQLCARIHAHARARTHTPTQTYALAVCARTWTDAMPAVWDRSVGRASQDHQLDQCHLVDTLRRCLDQLCYRSAA